MPSRFFSCLRWVAISTAAVGFGFALGLLIGVPNRWPIDVAIAGAAVRLLGGPVFGLAVGLRHSLSLPRGQGRVRRVLTFAAIGGVVFPAMLSVVASIRSGGLSMILDDSILPVVGEIMFLAGTGAIFGLAFGGKTLKSKQKASDTLNELVI